MSIKYKKVTEEKFKELTKRVRQQLHETLVAAIMALDRKEVNGGYQYERIGFILKVQDEKLPYIVQTNDGQFLKYGDVVKAKFMLNEYEKADKFYNSNVKNQTVNVKE